VTIIDRFEGRHAFLSNFFVDVDGWCVEHYYQAAKALSPTQGEWVMQAPTPGAAKKRGRVVTIRHDWDDVKIGVMEKLVREKFTRNPDLRRQLLETGDAFLIEGNWWGDRFWGVCNGQGKNHLGEILMKLRKELREQ
jgi:ribA/ribD-fused uncharacterized protein